MIAGKHRRIGKECDRRWEEGDDFESIMEYETIEYTKKGEERTPDGTAEADEWLIQQIRKIGIRPLVRFGCGERILEKICRQKPVRFEVLRSYQQKVQEYKSKT